MNHQAIYNTHPEVKTIIDNEDSTVTCYDANGNIVNINQSIYEAQFPAVEFDMAMEDLRAKRNKDLQDSDWTQLSDNTLTNDQRQAYMRYRTELRNITDGLTTVEQVNNIDYPDKPK